METVTVISHATSLIIQHKLSPQMRALSPANLKERLAKTELGPSTQTISQ